ncbi:MAG: terminase large subunit domain-containing protein [Caulobacteraceae bacterium]
MRPSPDFNDGSGTPRRPWWTPQPGPQRAFVASNIFEVVYGGARGGGKTDAALGDFALHAMRYGGAAKGLLVRRTRVALGPTIERAKAIFGPAGAVWGETKSTFVWPDGAILYCRHLDRDADADAYQGHDYTRVYVEELTQFASPTPVDKLKAVLRSAAGVPCGFRATCNPGGPGHNWVKARHIDPGPYLVVAEPFASPFGGPAIDLDRVFIPARLGDNPKLLESDPAYEARLQLSGSRELVRAWLEGDWNIVEGAFFDAWSARNVVVPFAIPAFWTRFRSFDWGYAVPFSVGWWAVASDPCPTAGGAVIPRGALVRYREWYGSSGRPNEGLRLTAEAAAGGILERERGETMAYGVADPSIFREDGGPSIGERLRRAGVYFRPADNTRVGKAGALSGWDQLRARISGGGIAGEEGTPMLYVFSTCRDFIRTVPILQHDPDRPEDLDTTAEDHVADETRYACLSRALIARNLDPVRAAREETERWRREWGGGLGGIVNDWKSR